MKTQRALIVEAALALERMAFVIAEPLDIDPVAELPNASHRAVIDIDGERTGFVLVAATDGFVREIAAGMLGIDFEEVVVEEHGEATVLELANVLGGHAIHEGDGDESTLRLCLPRIESQERCHELLLEAMANGFAGVVAAEQGRLVLAGVLPKG